jgi:hypothetical protein
MLTNVPGAGKLTLKLRQGPERTLQPEYANRMMFGTDAVLAVPSH